MILNVIEHFVWWLVRWIGLVPDAEFYRTMWEVYG